METDALLPASQRDQVVRYTSRLIQTPSVLGQEEAVARIFLDCLGESGFDETGIDELGNVWGVIHLADSGPTLMLDGHLDTVGVEPVSAWSRSPFSGDLVDGRIYGRGASDMKGALAAMAVGVGGMTRSGGCGRVVVVGSLGEETTEGTALRSLLDRFRPDAVIIGEATELQIAVAGRGRAEYRLGVRGRRAHASTPHLGCSAVEMMSRFVLSLGALPLASDPVTGPAVWCVTDLISTPYPAESTVPFACTATLERRLLPGETRASVEGEVLSALKSAAVPDHTLELARTRYTTWKGGTLECEKWYSPWSCPVGSSVVEAARRGLPKLGMPARLTAYRFCTNAAEAAGIRGLPTIGFGPSSEAHAHVVDESVDLHQLFGAAAGYRAVCEAFLRA